MSIFDYKLLNLVPFKVVFHVFFVLCSAFALSVDGNAELQRHNPAADTGAEHCLNATHHVVSADKALAGVCMAVATVMDSACAWCREVENKLVDVPGLVDLANL